MRWYDFPQPRVFSITAPEDFLSLISQELLNSPASDNTPYSLADTQIFVPNRRIAAELEQTLLNQADHQALMLPRIRVLGDIGTADASAAPAVPDGQRRGIIAQFVQTLWQTEKRPPLSVAHILAATDQLTELLDLAEDHGNIDWDSMQNTIQESHLAAHWEINAKFLQIVAKHWPKWMDEHHFSDAAHRRRLAIETLAQEWTDKNPILILGSTGASKTIRTLMQTVKNLPKGAIVLPALDRQASDKDWSHIYQTPSHPQHVLRHTLKTLEIKPESVRPWPGSSNTHTQRIRFINETLIPAAVTGDWHKRLHRLDENVPAFTHQALNGLKTVTGDNDGQTARIAALILRKTLEQQNQTAALVTPDPLFARRVSSLLARWNINVSPSGGYPFNLSTAGSFFSALFHWMHEPDNPLKCLALWKHPLCQAGRNETQKCQHSVEILALRGTKNYAGLEELAQKLTTHATAPQAAQWVREMDAALTPIKTLQAEAAPGHKLLQALCELAETLCAPASPWEGADGAKATKLMEKMYDMLSVWTDMPPNNLPVLFDSLCQDQDLRVNPANSHPKLAIWGQLEARLQHRDVLVLAGLNEGVWPQQPPESWLPRHLREKAGLPDPEERIGLAAHDFAQLACKSEVWMLRSARSNGEPTIASRWWWRLNTLAEAALGKTQAQIALSPDNFDPKATAKAMMSPDSISPAKPPEPRPAQEFRPKRYSMTRARNLITDPFSVYARDILKLKPLAPPGSDMQPRDTGIAIHAALSHSENLANAESLVECIGQHLLKAGLPENRFAMRRNVWRQMAESWMEWRKKRRTLAVYTEIKGELSQGKFTLIARADRIEEIKPGLYAIIDFKTGRTPAKKDVLAGRDPQMLLQAAILNHGGFAKLHGQTSEIIHYRFHDNKQDGCYAQTISVSEQDAEQLLKDFLALAEQFMNPEQPFLSRPDPQCAPAQSDYDRLARRAEWDNN